MRRFIVEERPSEDGLFRLSGKDFRYLARVLRLGSGDRFRALFPSGEESVAVIVSVGPSSLAAQVERVAPEPAIARPEAAPGLCEAGAEGLEAERAADASRRAALPALPPLVLLQALPKGQKMDLIVRQAVEAGVACIIPFVARRSVSRVESPSPPPPQPARWERIAKEARQQSGSDIATVVAAPTSLEVALERWEAISRERGGGVGILLHQDPLAQGTLHGYLSGDPHAVALAVGPEGGFAVLEAETLMAAGFAPTLVGANVLRTETAALFAIAAVQTVLLEKASWMLKTPSSPASRESLS